MDLASLLKTYIGPYARVRDRQCTDMLQYL
jgi:hypothetical protein